MKVLFATTNPAKVNKYKQALEDKEIELITIKDLEINLPINENGKNAIENAYIKAKTYYESTKIPAISIIPEFNKYLVDLTEEEKNRYRKKDNIDEVIDFISKSI